MPAHATEAVRVLVKAETRCRRRVGVDSDGIEGRSEVVMLAARCYWFIL